MCISRPERLARGVQRLLPGGSQAAARPGVDPDAQPVDSDRGALSPSWSTLPHDQMWKRPQSRNSISSTGNYPAAPYDQSPRFSSTAWFCGTLIRQRKSGRPAQWLPPIAPRRRTARPDAETARPGKHHLLVESNRGALSVLTRASSPKCSTQARSPRASTAPALEDHLRQQNAPAEVRWRSLAFERLPQPRVVEFLMLAGCDRKPPRPDNMRFFTVTDDV